MRQLRDIKKNCYPGPTTVLTKSNKTKTRVEFYTIIMDNIEM